MFRGTPCSYKFTHGYVNSFGFNFVWMILIVKSLPHGKDKNYGITYGWDGSDYLSKFQFVKNCSFTSSIQSNYQLTIQSNVKNIKNKLTVGSHNTKFKSENLKVHRFSG